MDTTIVAARTLTAKTRSVGLNFNKLMAVLCIAASAAISVAVIVWIAQTFF